MISVTFNAFSFLQKTFREKNLEYANARLSLAEGTTPSDLMRRFALEDAEVEAVFVNGKVCPKETRLSDGDRVAFVPPGTPGPYRVMLGMIKRQGH